MNRMEFIESLKCSQNFNQYFDEFMMFYDIISRYDTINVENYNIIDNNKILFNVSIPSDVSAFHVKNRLDSMIPKKYNSIFILETNITDVDKLNIILYKIRSF